MKRRGRPEKWENTARRALMALGGQAVEIDVLRWIQEGRVNLAPGWQAQVLAALRDNSDGKGSGFFELVSDDPREWRLTEWWRRSRQPRQSHGVGTGRFLEQMIVRAARDYEADDLGALDCYLLAVMAYELEWHREAIALIDLAIENGLRPPYVAKAEQYRRICSIKLEGA